MFKSQNLRDGDRRAHLEQRRNVNAPVSSSSFDNQPDPPVGPSSRSRNIDGNSSIPFKIKKERVKLALLGHDDAGKSTIGCQLLYLTGMVDQRAFHKYHCRGVNQGSKSWYLSMAAESNFKKYQKGKTRTVLPPFVRTNTKYFQLIDTSHPKFVPDLIKARAQVDVALLVISARKGEFTSTFQSACEQTHWIALAGVQFLIVLVNRMDDPTVAWSEGRFNHIKEKTVPFLTRLGFKLGDNLTFIPVSDATGTGLKDPVDPTLSPWYLGQPLIPLIEALPKMDRNGDSIIGADMIRTCTFNPYSAPDLSGVSPMTSTPIANQGIRVRSTVVGTARPNTMGNKPNDTLEQTRFARTVTMDFSPYNNSINRAETVGSIGISPLPRRNTLPLDSLNMGNYTLAEQLRMQRDIDYVSLISSLPTGTNSTRRCILKVPTDNRRRPFQNPSGGLTENIDSISFEEPPTPIPLACRSKLGKRGTTFMDGFAENTEYEETYEEEDEDYDFEEFEEDED